MSSRIIDFPDGYTNESAPVFGAGIGDGSLQPVQESPTGVVDGTNANFALAYTPFSEDCCLVFVDGIQRVKDTQWNLSGSSIVFVPGFVPVGGQDVKVYYFRESAALVTPAGTNHKTESRTISSMEATGKAMTLIQTPTTPGEVSVFVYGGSVAFYSTDYTVSGTTLSWTGLGFDGLLAAGDQLVIEYNY